MNTLSTHRKVAVAIAIAFTLVLVLMLAPIFMELQAIPTTKDQYSFESAVTDEALKRANKPKVEEVLNPAFLRKCSLDLDEYLDAEGYFAPNGNHWNKWSLETKTATILLRRESQATSAWELRRTIHRVTEYYSQDDLNTPLMEVVNAATQG